MDLLLFKVLQNIILLLKGHRHCTKLNNMLLFISSESLIMYKYMLNKKLDEM